MCFSANLESTINGDTSIKTKDVLTHISNFNFSISLIIPRKVFDCADWGTALLQAKSINEFELIRFLIYLILNFIVSIDKYFDEWYSKACQLVQKVNDNESVPRTCSRQTTKEDFLAELSSRYYKLFLSILIDWYYFKWIEKEIWRKPKIIFEVCL